MNLAAITDLFPGAPSPGEIYYRMANQTYASTIDDIGPSFLYGGRYNPPGEFGVLYLSTSAECAYQERLRQVKGRKDNLLPQIAASFHVKIERCLALIHDVVLQAIGIVREDLIQTNSFSTPQSIARAARNVGIEAILAPSAAGDECGVLVVFKDKLSPPSFCAVAQGSIKPYSIR